MPHELCVRRSGTPGTSGRPLLVIKCLDLALLIDAQDECSVRRRKLTPDDIAYLVDEQRV